MLTLQGFLALILCSFIQLFPILKLDPQNQTCGQGTTENTFSMLTLQGFLALILCSFIQLFPILEVCCFTTIAKNGSSTLAKQTLCHNLHHELYTQNFRHFCQVYSFEVKID
jgi:hypothetical protein